MEGSPPPPGREFDALRPWLRAAAAYNVTWGLLAALCPRPMLRLLGLPTDGTTVALWQVLGMFVLVYAPGYWWAARDPARHGHLVLIGLAGKLLGPMGFLWTVRRGHLPWRFGLTLLTNDLLWWPSFIAFARALARGDGGWPRLLRG